jgi:hypothetical protein
MLELNSNELAQLNQFIAHHERCFDANKYQSIIHLHFTGTGIGIAIMAECEQCGECINLTDYGCW